MSDMQRLHDRLSEKAYYAVRDAMKEGVSDDELQALTLYAADIDDVVLNAARDELEHRKGS